MLDMKLVVNPAVVNESETMHAKMGTDATPITGHVNPLKKLREVSVTCGRGSSAAARGQSEKMRFGGGNNGARFIIINLRLFSMEELLAGWLGRKNDIF